MPLIPVICVLPAYCHKVYLLVVSPGDLELAKNPDTWHELVSKGVVAAEKIPAMRDAFNTGRKTCYFTGEKLEKSGESEQCSSSSDRDGSKADTNPVDAAIAVQVLPSQPKSDNEDKECVQVEPEEHNDDGMAQELQELEDQLSATSTK